MKKTPNLNLPVYDTPNVDTFKVEDWNNANETLDEIFGELKNNPNVNAIDITARQDIINNHRSVTSQLEENTQEFNFIFVSDLHFMDYISNAEIGVDGETRAKHFIDAIRKEYDKRPINAIFCLGDISSDDLPKCNNTGVKWFKDNVVDKIGIPTYCLPGNHDCKTDQQWIDIFGYPRNHTVVIGSYVFIMCSTFEDDINLTWGTWGRNPVNVDYVKTQLNKHSDKKCFILAHSIGVPLDNALFTELRLHNNVVGICVGHSHETKIEVPYNFPEFKIYHDGHYSKSFDIMPTTEAIDWNFMRFNSSEGFLTKHNIYVENSKYEYQDKDVENWIGTEPVYDKFNTKNSSEISNKGFMKGLDNQRLEIDDLQGQVSNDDYEIIEGDTITYTPKMTITYPIGLKGKTIPSSATPSIETPCTFTHSNASGISVKIGGTTKTYSAITNLKSTPIAFDMVQNNQVVKNVSTITFNGTIGENWQLASCTSPNHLRFMISINDLLQSKTLSGYDKNVYCNKFESESLSYVSSERLNKECCYATSSNRSFVIIIRKDRLSTQDVAGLKTFLSSNPITVIYPCEPTGLDKVDLNVNFIKDTPITIENLGVGENGNLLLSFPKTVLSLALLGVNNSYKAMDSSEKEETYWVGANATTICTTAQTEVNIPFSPNKYRYVAYSSATKDFLIQQSGLFSMVYRFIIKNTSTGVANGRLKVFMYVNDVKFDEFRYDMTDMKVNGLVTTGFARHTKFNVGDKVRFTAYSDVANVSLYEYNNLLEFQLIV